MALTPVVAEAEVANTGPARAPARIRPERVKELSLIGVILLMLVVFSFLVDDYLSGRLFNRVTTSVVITAVLALAQTIVIVTRNIDLSVGSMVGVSAYLTGELVRSILRTCRWRASRSPSGSGCCSAPSTSSSPTGGFSLS